MKIKCREACFPPGFPHLCWFLDAGNDSGASYSRRPAPKKRQGTKSREVWHPAGRTAMGI
jgi:hypothetical protein